MRKVREVFSSYTDFIFDLDGVITQEERYFDAAALCVYEALLEADHMTLSAEEGIANLPFIRKQVFWHDKILRLLKMRGVNASCDLAYLTFCLILSTGLGQTEVLSLRLEEQKELSAFSLFGIGAHIASDRLSLPLSDCLRGGKLWQDLYDIYHTWLLGSDGFRARFHRAPRGEDKPSLLLTEEPLLPPPAILNTLRTLKEAGKRLCVATGRLRDDCAHAFSLAGIEGLFDEDGFITYDDVLKAEAKTNQTLTKPHPWMFEKALFGRSCADSRIIAGDIDKSKLKTALIIGDAGADFQAANAMQADFMAVLTGVTGEEGRSLFQGARFIENDVTALIEDTEKPKGGIFMAKITKETIIADVLKLNPDSAPLFLEIGMHCLHCPASTGESIEEACAVHGVDADELVEKLNAIMPE